MNIETLARYESSIRPFLATLPPAFIIKRYSHGRGRFLDKLVGGQPPVISPPRDLQRTLWGITFRSGIMNAAGMFKAGRGYDLVARQGAGAYLAGTTTGDKRAGNAKRGIRLPFMPYPRSGAASNWLGLPNPGHAAVAARLAHIERVPGCPVGASLMTDPGQSGKQALEQLCEGLRLFEQAGVDFIEINESCPNAGHANTTIDELASRLEYISDHFLKHRSRNLPVIVKFSVDTEPGDIGSLVDILTTLSYDGLNIGNTSTRYDVLRNAIHPGEQRLYDYFTAQFGGGVSGKPLRDRSLDLTAAAVQYCADHPPAREFHVIRTGGIESAADVQATEQAGVALAQWYTGYFEAFAQYGHGAYAQLYKAIVEHDMERAG